MTCHPAPPGSVIPPESSRRVDSGERRVAFAELAALQSPLAPSRQNIAARHVVDVHPCLRAQRTGAREQHHHRVTTVRRSTKPLLRLILRLEHPPALRV